MIEKAGFRIDRIETGYIPRPRPLTFMYEGTRGRTSSKVDATAGTSDEGSKSPRGSSASIYLRAPRPPSPVLVAEPVRLSLATPTFLLENHPGLDTPPPKRLT